MSARLARRLLAAGRVRVDGVRCTDLAAVVAAGSSVIVARRGAGLGLEEVHAPHPREYYFKFFKPRGVVCSHREEKRNPRPIVSALYPPGTGDVLHACGRLDCESEGLLLLTSDGLFSRFATMPEVHLEKEYLAVVDCACGGEPPPDELLQRLRNGVDLGEGGEARAKVAEVVRFDGRYAQLRLVVTEGRHRLVRRLLNAIGYDCLQLLRTRIGKVEGVATRPATLAEAAAEHLAAAAGRRPPAVAPARVLGSGAGAGAGGAGAALPPPPPPPLLLPGEAACLEAEEVQAIYRRGLAWLQEQHPV